MALEGALEQIGWIQQVIVNKTTGHIVDGHARVQLALRRNEKTAPVLYVELTEAEERMALASLDPLSAMAVTDAEQLYKLLDDLKADNQALDEFLNDQREIAHVAILDRPDPRAIGKNGHATVKVVLPATDLRLLEQALSATGHMNRGEAILEICRAYLESGDEQKGQQHTKP